ncbi:MAG: phosphoenolpyruvate--protein phosphotransferase [Nitrospinae bacterium]|nr:phosphoenolpyruvate--protein phosphotransferase [Nitrospinota bacterium]
MEEAAKTKDENILTGIPASSGIVIGKAYVIDRHMICVLERALAESEIAAEISRFLDAVDASLNEMIELADKAASEFGESAPTFIFDAHAQILRDQAMIREVEEIIKQRKCNAEWALKILLEKFQKSFSRIKDHYFRERLSDIEQVVGRIQRHLIHEDTQSLAGLKDPVIIVAHDLSPADTLSLSGARVIGFATDAGGKTSHAGIIASSMDIPAVVGLKNLSMRVRSGDPVIVDGNNGEVVHLPTKDQFLKYIKRRQRYIYFDREVHAQKHLEAVSRDGVKVSVMANIESSHDLAHLAEHGADGVGLYRTEYLYINRLKWPDEAEQFADYMKVAQAVGANHAVIRTLDIGGDKIALTGEFYEPEPNPALGLRAIRYCLAYPEVFRIQLRAILRASHYGHLKIMYPMITSIEEVDAANAILESVKEELRKEGQPFDDGIEVGIMIETPSSVVMAEELARRCSFFSIGTNDLIQYTMAIDRVNERVAYLYQPFSPAIVRMLLQTVRAAEKAGITVSVCGKMAGDPASAFLLLGMGAVRELSMDVHSIPKLKKLIRSVSVREASSMVEQALTMNATDDIRDYVNASLKTLAPEGIGATISDNGD